MKREVWASFLLALPAGVRSALMFLPSYEHSNRALIITMIVSCAFMVVLFFLMMRTGKTYRWRTCQITATLQLAAKFVF